MKTILRWSFATLALAGLPTASPALAANAAPAPKPGVLVVEDSGNLFSRDGIKKAKDEFAQLKSAIERNVTILTMSALPMAEKERLDKIDPNDKVAVKRFWVDLAKREAKEEHAKNIFILVCRKPGYVEIVADQAMRDRGFDNSKEERIKEILLTSFRSAKDKDEAEALTMRDKGLMEAVGVLRAEVPVATDAKTGQAGHAQAKKDGSGWQSYLCLGICVLLGIWLVVGLIRAFSGGGGGGGPGGGGGGGGFFSGLMGGLFGAMAGMWLYNNLFGGGMSSAWGDSGSGGDYGGGSEAGTGDFSGDQGAGGDFDGGGSGGGDWSGGGGGDWGGGGGGGGGGDWGGGGGDF